MLIATPNLCFDRTVPLTELRVGAVHRSRRAAVTAGGKGVNVARVLRAHGRTPLLTGLLPSADGAELERLLADEGATFVGVEVAGAARVATILVEDGGRVTVVNEPGPVVNADTWESYWRLVTGRDEARDVVVCTGSLPPGVPDAGYGQLVSGVREAADRTASAGTPAAGSRSAGAASPAAAPLVVVDAARQALARSLPAAPDLVTPNLAEAEAVLGGEARVVEVVDDDADDVLARAAAAAHGLVRAGARRAAVTVGAAGVVLADARTSVTVPAPPVHVVSAVGAGDAFVAGVVDGLARGEDWPAATRRGVATASASCEQLRAGSVDLGRVEELLALTTAAVATGAAT